MENAFNSLEQLDARSKVLLEPLLELCETSIKETKTTFKYNFHKKLIEEGKLKLGTIEESELKFINSKLSPAFSNKMESQTLKQAINNDIESSEGSS